MEQKVKELKLKLEKVEKLTESKKEKDIEYKKSIVALIEEVSDLSKEIEILKKDIEGVIIPKFEKTKEKKYFGGLGVKEYLTYEYDEKEALKWAKEKDMFLVLDKKGFEKSVQNLNLDFVKSDKKPKVTYPKIIKIDD